jgi:hypothetical protein
MIRNSKENLMRSIYVFGNPDIEMDAVAPSLLSELRTLFPDEEFVFRDPNEDWDIPEDLIVLDTVVGIHAVTLFEGLENFAAAPHVSVHDFDAYANLRLLEKLGKVTRVRIIGIPAGVKKDAVRTEVVELLARVLSPS